MTVTEFLQTQVPLLRGLTWEQARELALSVDQRSFAQNQTVLLRGAMGDGLYVVAAGRVAVWAKLPGDRFLIEVGQLGPGEVFGETSMLEKGAAGATVNAADDETLVFVIPEKAFRAVLVRNPAVAARISAIISSRKRSTTTLTVTEFLRTQVPLLNGMTKEQAQQLALSVEQRRYKRDHTVLFRATTAEGLYVVAAGRVAVLAKPPNGKVPLQVGELGPGEVFGEISIMEVGIAGASVKAVEDETLILVVPEEAFREVAALNPQVEARASALGSFRKGKNADIFATLLGTGSATPVAA